jgi:hypothetical protein
MKQWEVQEHTANGWMNTWSYVDGNPMRFNSPAEDQEELDGFLEDVREDVLFGDIVEEYDPEDFRIVEISS